MRDRRDDDAAWVERREVGVGGQKGEGEGEGVSKVEGCQQKVMMVIWGKGENHKGTPLIYDGWDRTRDASKGCLQGND